MASEGRTGLFAGVEKLPPNPIFDLTARFKADTHPDKLNLGVGAYRDADLKPYVFSVVRKAEEHLVTAHVNHEYLPIAGYPAFREAAARIILGPDSPAIASKRVASCQSLSGTGALRLAAEFVKRQFAGSRVYIPNPTWGNHRAIFNDVGLKDSVFTYEYYDPATCGLDFDRYLADIKAMPTGSVLLLQACACNPTGVDPTPDQWDVLIASAKARGLILLFDCAYQGFASGDIDRDVYSIRCAEALGCEFFVAQSFAKNMGLYSERTGCVHVVCGDSESALAVLSVLEVIVRPMYSNPPAHGARTVAHILDTPALFEEWKSEVAGVTRRVHKMREMLYAAIVEAGIPGDWTHVTKQIGMFSFTGLTKEQSEAMVNDHHVYMLANGRINVAGLNEAAIPLLVRALKAVVEGGSSAGEAKL